MSGAVALFKRGLHEVPHLVIGGALFTLFSGLYMFSTYRNTKYHRELRNWKRRYTVVREEDFDPNKQIHHSDRKYPIF